MFRHRDSLKTMQDRVKKLGSDLIESIAGANLNPTYIAWMKDNKTELETFNKEQEEKRKLLELPEGTKKWFVI